MVGWKHKKSRGGSKINPVYFAATGTNYHYGNEYLKPEIKLRLIKRPDNKVDKRVIRVELEGLGKVGYVVSGPHSVIGDSYNAGQLHDKIGDAAEGKMLHVLSQGVLCTLVQGEEGGKPSSPRNAMRPKK